jgi:homoaconitase/3-isopropylmalate dehydratase large subunit
MAVTVEGELPADVTAKDLMLGILNRIGTGGGVGHVIEYRGEAVRQLSMEGRMTVCNMSIEGGARAGLVAPDETTFEYLEGREYAPKGEHWQAAVEEWKKLPTDEGAEFRRRTWSPMSPGAQPRRRPSRSTARFQSRRTKATRGRSSTWRSNRAPPSGT